MPDYTPGTRRGDQPEPQGERLDYAKIMEVLAFPEDGSWTFIDTFKNARVAESLKRHARNSPTMQWGWELETFTRRMRPNKDGKSPGIEVWARIIK